MMLLAILVSHAALAQSWATRPVRVVVPFAAGAGINDIMARLVGQHLGAGLGQPVVIENRAGSGGIAGTEAAAKAAPDGTTFLMTNVSLITSAYLYPKLSYDPQKDLVPVTLVATSPLLLVVNPAVPAKSVQEFVAYAKANPGKVTVGSTGIGSDDHLLMLMFERAAGVKMTHVPFKGSSDVRAALQTRQIVVAAINVGEALQGIRGGTPMRNIAQFAPARTNLAPDLPTGHEQGFDIELSSLRGMAAPKGLPADIRDRLVKAVETAANDAEFQAQATKFFAPLRFLTPAQFEKEIREAEAGFRQLYKEMPWGDR